MNIDKSNFTLQSCDFSGGFAYLRGSTVTANILGKSDISQTSAKTNGGAFYIEATSGISLLKLTDISVTNSKTETSGGFLYAKGTTAKLLMETNAKLTAIGAKGTGGVALMDGSTNSEIELTDMASISQGESTTDSGGIAYFKGTNNYLKIKNGAVVA
jgi:hypothetical protein